MKHGNTQSEIEAGKKQWDNLAATTDPDTMSLAKQWADTMEGWLKKRKKVEFAAILALEEVGGEKLVANHAKCKELIVILHKSWYCGGSLYRWAQKRNYL